MNLPFFRIPELEEDLARKREAFGNSVEELKESFRAKTKPIALLRDHPQLLIAALFSSVSMAKLVKNFISGGSSKNGIGRGGGSIPARLAGLVGKAGFKFLLPLAMGSIKYAFKKFRK